MTLAKGQFLTQSEFDGSLVSKENYIEHTYEVVQIFDTDYVAGDKKTTKSYIVRLEVVR